MKKSGAQVLLECLAREGVDTIFGYPGGAVLPIYDALYDFKEIRHILTRHEQGAAHAADGYARVTGKVGVCLATSGPGATNLVTGIANAYMDSIPMVALTGQVASPLLGRDSFQEADITGITLPITKHNYLVRDAKELPRIVKEAFHLASSGRPGPVLIDLPKDILANKTEAKVPEKVVIQSYRPTYKGHINQINKAAKLIQRSHKPVIYAGGGVIASNAAQELKKFAELIGAPVTTTLMGIGAFPETHPHSLGMIGMHGTAYANLAVTECDLLIAIGARFDDRVTGKIETFAPDAKVIHIDIDPAEIGKNVGVDIPIVGDVGAVLEKLIECIPQLDRAEWLERIVKMIQEYPLTYEQTEEKIKPQYVIDQIYEVTNGEAIIATEVGQHQMWAAQLYKFDNPRTFVSSGGLGTMGFGFPAAIGAQVGMPDKAVFNIAGDGSIQMNIQELATAVENDLPVKVVIMNNGYLGMVRQWQEMFHGKRYSFTPLKGNPDFVKLAESYGAVGIRVTDPKDVRPALEKAMATPKPVFLDFIVEPEENVYPMVPPGGALNSMIRGRE